MIERYINPFTDFGFKKLFGEEANTEIANYNESEREAYHDSVKYYRDLKNSLDTAREEGGQAMLTTLIFKMKVRGDSVADIAALTGLTEAEITALWFSVK
jgi:hypothetical protein